jgi:hypothetical protein
MPFGSPALLVAGAGPDAAYEGLLTLATNGQSLNFAGYCQAYPFAGPDVSVIGGGSGNWHGIAGVNAYGYYTLSYTNTGLYSAGNHRIHGAVDLNGSGTNFYATGQAGSGNGIKFCDTAFQPANGVGIASVAGSFAGTRVAQNIGGNLVFSDGDASPNGIYACLGLPVNTASAGLMIAETNSPMDFASSPDLQTVYIADDGAFFGTGTNAGGIQRWDANGTSAYGYPTYAFSYTLGTGSGSIVGARGLTVDFSAAGAWGAGVTGAKLYATTAEPSGNRLIKIVDMGAASSATVLATVSASQILSGVRFGPTIVAPAFAVEPQPASALAGSPATLSAPAGRCLGARADRDALVEDRFHQCACDGEGVFVLREVFAQQLGDRRGLPRVGVRDQRFVDRDLIVLGLARDREDQHIGERVVALLDHRVAFVGQRFDDPAARVIDGFVQEREAVLNVRDVLQRLFAVHGQRVPDLLA